MTEDEEPKLRRRPHTKSRNGCVPCKKRRVKCDETHPKCRNCHHMQLDCQYLSNGITTQPTLQMMDLRLFHHYITVVAQSIAAAGIGSPEVWVTDVTELACKFEFLMHAVLMFSATHLTQVDPSTYEMPVVNHRQRALVDLRKHMEQITPENMDALVATSVLLALDAMANAASPQNMTLCSLPASTWLHHVRGSATILLAVGQLPASSKFFTFMGTDMFEFADVQRALPVLECFDARIKDLYPVDPKSPFFPVLAHLDRLNNQQHVPDYVLRVFSFPALLDPVMVELVKVRDPVALRIVGVWYSLVRDFLSKNGSSLWFLKGIKQVLPIDLDQQLGGLGFIQSALPVAENLENLLHSFDNAFLSANGETEDAFSLLSGDLSGLEDQLDDSLWLDKDNL